MCSQTLHVSRETKLTLQVAVLILSATVLAISIMIETSYLLPIITSLTDNWLQNYSLAHNKYYVADMLTCK